MWRLVLSCARKDLLRRLRDPAAFALWLGIPLAIGGLISLAMGGSGGGKPQAHVLVVDRDDTFLSELLLKALTQGEAGELFRIERVEEAEGRARIGRGDGSALLVLPAGFAEALLQETPLELELVTNPEQTILPGIVEETVGMLSELVFYAHRVVGPQLKDFAQEPPDGASVFPDAQIADFSVRVNRTVERLQDWLFPPVLVLEERAAAGAADAPRPSLAALFFPSMLLMTLFFLAQGISEDVWTERHQGTLRRMLATPGRTGALLAGKLLAAGVLIAAIALVALALGAALFRMPAGGLALAFPWIVLVGVVLTAGFVLVQLLARTQRAGSLISNLVLFPLLMLGGAFFPLEVMPGWMAQLGRRTPNGWALVELKAMLAGQADAGRVALAFAAALAVLVLLWLASARRLERSFARGV